jgi:hypothetical protein
LCFIILFFIASLPQQLQGELNLASRTGAPDAPERSGVDRGVRVREVHLVEKVEKLRPELKPHPLRECEVFDGREIRVVVFDSTLLETFCSTSVAVTRAFGTSDPL